MCQGHSSTAVALEPKLVKCIPVWRIGISIRTKSNKTVPFGVVRLQVTQVGVPFVSNDLIIKTYNNCILQRRLLRLPCRKWNTGSGWSFCVKWSLLTDLSVLVPNVCLSVCLRVATGKQASKGARENNTGKNSWPQSIHLQQICQLVNYIWKMNGTEQVDRFETNIQNQNPERE